MSLYKVIRTESRKNEHCSLPFTVVSSTREEQPMSQGTLHELLQALQFFA